MFFFIYRIVEMRMNSQSPLPLWLFYISEGRKIAQKIASVFVDAGYPYIFLYISAAHLAAAGSFFSGAAAGFS